MIDLSLRDSVKCYFFIHMRLRVEPLLLYLERSQIRWFRRLIRKPPQCLPWGGPRCSSHWEETPWQTKDQIISPCWPGNASGSPRRKWLMLLRKGRSGALCWNCCPHDPDKLLKMEWMDGLLIYCTQLTQPVIKCLAQGVLNSSC